MKEIILIRKKCTLSGRNTKYGNNEILNVIPVIRTGKLSA
jgi:hypothetical protein